MYRLNLRVVKDSPLSYLLSLPGGREPACGVWPLLCFLHGYGEAASVPIREALTLHGPLAKTSASIATKEFIVIAPQLPTPGDHWYRYADAVRNIVQSIHVNHQADPEQTFLTGFSFGGNGVFDLAATQSDLWAALWPVDPTRVPEIAPQVPIWLSSGQISRPFARAFIEQLRLEPLREIESAERLYVDEGEDHVGTARLAYHDDRIYRWLLSKQLCKPAQSNLQIPS